tara:strand:- start:255 stop:482 length:228 start_codon:yes stop_codon:yes gene_type:complete
MKYYKGLKEIGKTGEFDKISTELLLDYINDFSVEFNNRGMRVKSTTPFVSKCYTKKDMDDAYDKGYNDAMKGKKW